MGSGVNKHSYTWVAELQKWQICLGALFAIAFVLLYIYFIYPVLPGIAPHNQSKVKMGFKKTFIDMFQYFWRQQDFAP